MTEKLMLKFTTSESHYVYGDIVIYDCDSNYRLIGASMVYCTENGTWSKPTPSCKRKYLRLWLDLSYRLLKAIEVLCSKEKLDLNISWVQ